MQKSKHPLFQKPALLVLVIFGLASVEAATTAPQIDWVPPGFEIAEPGGTTFNYPDQA